jgi:outer membrane biosynthesis protein TonB
LIPLKGTTSQAATEAVRQWRYEPAKGRSGKPVAVEFTVTVSFWLN